MTKVVVFSGYLPNVDEFRNVTVHGVRFGYTLCGRAVASFAKHEKTGRPIDCKVCGRLVRNSEKS